MVTLITEKLQSQSLDDLACKSCDAGLRSAGTLSNSGHFSPFESNEDRRPWKVLSGGWPVGSQTATGTRGPDTGLGAVSATDLRESAGPPSAPPTKRHCRSLSEPDGLARCRSPWRPGGSKVWTPVSKRRCHSGGSATLQESPGASLPRSATLLGCALPVAGPTSPPTPPGTFSQRQLWGRQGGRLGTTLATRRAPRSVLEAPPVPVTGAPGGSGHAPALRQQQPLVHTRAGPAAGPAAVPLAALCARWEEVAAQAQA